MPSRKSAAVSSSQWTESFGCGAAACACARCETLSIISRTGKIMQCVRVVMGKFPSAANSSTRNARIKTYQSPKQEWAGRIARPRRINSPPLFQEDFLQQLRADDLPNFGALLVKLLSGSFTTQDLVAHRLTLRRQTVQGGVVLVLDGDADVPILGAVLGLLEEDLVVDDRALLLTFLVDRFGGLAQHGEIGIHVRGLNADQGYAPDGTFRVVLLREQCRRE